MTRATYDKYCRQEEHVGKHEMKHYNVWRVLSPSGPEETFSVYGIETAASYIDGCYDYEVTDMCGRIIPDSTLFLFLRKDGIYVA